ncbi:MAG TPA: RNA polymerase sigma factor [Blastocatellia bacterium]|nr:RNA polymerase sigma factor [Blastocatellia bacterium]
MADVTETERESWWVLRAQSGDHEALSALLKAVQGPLFRYIVSLVREQPLAEDILQEVFIRIYRKLKWLEEPEMFRAWAYRIATRETFRHLKRERRWAEQVRDESALKMIPSPPPREEFAPELLDRLPQMITSLSPASRAVIVLYYLHEMSLDEAAAVLQIPLGTVKSRLAYGLASLRQQLKKNNGGRDVEQ